MPVEPDRPDRGRAGAACEAPPTLADLPADVDDAVLLGCLRAALRAPARPTSASAGCRAWPCRDEPGRSLHVLVAEDNRTNQKVIGKILEHAGHRATIVATGQEAVEALEEPGFDLVLMDLNMPVLGGIEAVKLLRFTHDVGRAAADRGAQRRCDAADPRGLPQRSASRPI